MTNHPDYAAEAHRILNALPAMIEQANQVGEDPAQITADVISNTRIATAFALLDVAAAIRTIGQTQPAVSPDRCGTIRTEWGNTNGLDLADYPCTLPTQHTGQHEDTDGETW